MMGIKARTFAPICNLSLKMLVPAEHFYRYVDARLDLGFARDLVRLRGLWKANVDALLIATGQKLKRLLRKRGWGRRPWPNGALEAPLARRQPPSPLSLHLSFT